MQAKPQEDNGNPESGSVDAQFAANILARRKEMNLTQDQLADQMRKAGFAHYRPQTVHRDENGQRKIGVGEAEAYSRILETSLAQLTWPDPVSNAVDFISMFTGRADEAYEQIASATGALLFARAHLERAAAEAKERGTDGHQQVRDALAEAAAALENATPERAVETGREDYERDHAAEEPR
jgi:transcriptional regulator with XRE-family HTH domain